MLAAILLLFNCQTPEEDVTKESLVKLINQVYDNRQTYIDTMAKSDSNDAIGTILGLIDKTAK